MHKSRLTEDRLGRILKMLVDERYLSRGYPRTLNGIVEADSVILDLQAAPRTRPVSSRTGPRRSRGNGDRFSVPGFAVCSQGEASDSGSGPIRDRLGRHLHTSRCFRARSGADRTQGPVKQKEDPPRIGRRLGRSGPSNAMGLAVGLSLAAQRRPVPRGS